MAGFAHVAKAVARSSTYKNKVARVMREAKAGTLHSGSAKGPLVTNRKQQIAIALSEARKAAS